MLYVFFFETRVPSQTTEIVLFRSLRIRSFLEMQKEIGFSMLERIGASFFLTGVLPFFLIQRLEQLVFSFGPILPRMMSRTSPEHAARGL